MQNYRDPNQVRAIIDAVKDAVANAAALRDRHRWKSYRGSLGRRVAIEYETERCKRAAIPIRSLIGMLPYHPELAEFDLELRATSAALTAERRRLRKMLPDPRFRPRGM